MRLIWCLYSALPPPLYSRSHLSEIINNYTFYLYCPESQSMWEIPSSIFLLSSRLITIALENSEYPQDVQTSTFLLLGLLNVFQVLFMAEQLFKNTTQRSALRLDSDEWQGVWDSIGKCLGQWSTPTFWNYTSEQEQNPENLVKYFEKVFCHPGNSRKTQITATRLGLTQAYQALFKIIRCPQGAEKVSGSDGKTTGSAATLVLATGTVAEQKNQHMPVSVSSVHKKKYWKQK